MIASDLLSDRFRRRLGAASGFTANVTTANVTTTTPVGAALATAVGR